MSSLYIELYFRVCVPLVSLLLLHIINIIYGTEASSVTVIAGRLLYQIFMSTNVVLGISIRNHLDRSGRAEIH